MLCLKCGKLDRLTSTYHLRACWPTNALMRGEEMDPNEECHLSDKRAQRHWMERSVCNPYRCSRKADMHYKRTGRAATHA